MLTSAQREVVPLLSISTSHWPSPPCLWPPQLSFADSRMSHRWKDHSFFCIWFLEPQLMPRESSVLLQVPATLPKCFQQHPLCDFVAVCVSSLLWVHVWVISSLGQLLGIKLVHVSCVCVCGHTSGHLLLFSTE